MNTPICDFVKKYAQSDFLRLHMPGHKGKTLLGMENLDITEIFGADSLYEADGIIAQSEENASKLFGCRTFYSTEGASQCIRAMLYLVLQQAKRQKRTPLIAAGRNAHKAFLSAVALLDLPVQWLYPEKGGSYLSCDLTPAQLESYLQNAQEKPAAVYLTSPDYLGKVADISALSEVCHRYGVLLLVDNAHGAYLRFLPESLHPMDLGADMCCDSAHKTLPALTGAAYLHLSETLSGLQVKNAMMLFGSTSPSYLILQSLDAVNLYLDSYPQRLAAFLPEVQALKGKLQKNGHVLYGDEPLKLTLDAAAYGCTGEELAAYLRRQKIEPEFADREYVVLMLTPEISLQRLEQALCAVPQKPPVEKPELPFTPAQQVLSVREAMLSQSEILPAKQCLGRIVAVPTVGCPPAVPILVCGERVTQQAIDLFAYYGITECCVVKE